LFFFVANKVVSGSPAHNRLHAGDVIIGVNGYDASTWTHQQAHDVIKEAGYSLNLMVRK
jgi:hypothetical protein